MSAVRFCVLPLLLTVLCAAAACAPRPDPPIGPAGPRTRAAGELDGPVLLHTNARRYAAGHQVRLTLMNGSGRIVEFNACNAELEVQTDGIWTPVPEPGLCAAVRIPVRPYGMASARVTLPEALPEGSYRYRLEMDSGGAFGYITVLSNAFRIR